MQTIASTGSDLVLSIVPNRLAIFNLLKLSFELGNPGHHLAAQRFFYYRINYNYIVAIDGWAD